MGVGGKAEIPFLGTTQTEVLTLLTLTSHQKQYLVKVIPYLHTDTLTYHTYICT